MSPFSAGFWITTSRGYPKDTRHYFTTGVSLSSHYEVVKFPNMRVFWSNMRVFRNVRVFENMSRQNLASTMAIVSLGPSRVPMASLGRKNMVVDCHM